MGLFHGLVPSSKDIRTIIVLRYVMSWPQLHMLGPVHSFGYNMGLFHGLVPISETIIYNGLVPYSKDVSYSNISLCPRFASTAHALTGQ